MNIEEFDALVRKKRCRKGECACHGCRDDQPPLGRPPPVHAAPPERSGFIDLAVRPYERATYSRDWANQMRALTEQLVDVHGELTEYQGRIGAGSTSGLGRFVRQGDALIDALQQHHSLAGNKRHAHRTMSIEALRREYDDVTSEYDALGIPHPTSHPIDSASVTSKTAMIEHLTESYELDPLALAMLG